MKLQKKKNNILNIDQFIKKYNRSLMEIKKRLYILFFTVFLVFLAGSVGYYFLFNGEYKFIDCVYMTVISLTSVGYGEVIQVTGNTQAQIFTMILIVLGMGVILYGISTTTAFLVEGGLSGILRKNKMEKQIQKLKKHYIVCGGGETGRPLLAELAKTREQTVLIEEDLQTIEHCKENTSDLLYIQGDATDDNNLVKAGIEHAAGVIISLPSDKDTLYVTMTARMLNKNIRIVSRMSDQKHEAKLKKAGADSVVSPNSIGALRMASEMIRPTAVGFLDTMLRSQKGDIRIHDLPISELSKFNGKKIMDAGMDEFRLLILGLRYTNGEMEFNPSPNIILKPGMTLIVMGEITKITEAGKK
jgi:voltage-gated potassium channel